MTVRKQVLALLDQGLAVSEVSRRTGVSRYAISERRSRIDQGRDLYARRYQDCPRCSTPQSLPDPGDAYAYVLGLYLGDGCLSPVGARHKEVWAPRIICANSWPGLIERCEEGIAALRPGNRVRRIPRIGCVEVNSHSKHWLVLLPAPRNGQEARAQNRAGRLAAGDRR